MKPVIIDKSLVGMNFYESAEKKEVFFYVCSLAEAGASYIELGLEAAVKLPKPNGSEKYIYRINGAEEHIIANAFEFAYAVVPLKYSFVIPKLTLPVILEIDVDGADVFETLGLVAGNLDFSRVNMIRLTGNFEPEQLSKIIFDYRRKMVLPIDVCPKNDRLSALSSAIAAYTANFDSVTVCFGDSDSFASLEELLIMLSAVHKIIISRDYLTGICKASLLSAVIAETKITNLSVMMRKYMYCPLDIENIDGKDGIRRSRPFGQNRFRRVPAVEKAVRALGIEREISESIIKALNGCDMGFPGKAEDSDDRELQ
ncbi:MAG: hypothetical protein LBI38_06940 [Oscillospiraceae bacterium]|nr:hypothetical protein [Oscillospiraceae bacterium]